MVKYLIARQLSGRKIITNEGEDFGRLIDLNINEVTGKIESLVSEPNPECELAVKLKKEDGLVYVPYEAVTAVGDYIIIDRRNINY
ncbi:MAG: PRC-barrel domain-containing protein [Candidatus Bilamarchaeaceae archaeon]